MFGLFRKPLFFGSIFIVILGAIFFGNRSVFIFASEFNWAEFFMASLSHVDEPIQVPVIVIKKPVEIEKPIVFVPVIDAKQEKIDEILEQIDVLNRQLADLQKAEDIPVIVEVAIEKPEETPVVVVIEPIPTSPAPRIVLASNSGASAPAIYEKLIISEVFVASIADSKDEFVELYNPNDEIIDLTGWYLQRKTKTASSFSTYAPNTLFSGKRIPGHGYFLIARESSIFAGDVFTDNPLTEDNALALKNPNGEIADKVGFGQALDFESAPALNPVAGQSIGRLFEQDSDNNVVDFGVENATPKSANIVATVQESPPVESSPAPVKIIINEIQIAGADEKDEFVKLYNPNTMDVDLTGWYLQRKTKTASSFATYAPNTLFAGKTILAGGYITIARADSVFLGDIFTDNPLTDDNTLALKNPDGEIIDKVGFGEASDFEIAPAVNPSAGKSIARVGNVDSDNNFADFALQNPPETPPTPEETPENPPIDELPAISGSQPNVVINEIAWMGFANSANAEWMELYNPGNTEIDMIGWKLQSVDGTPNISLTGKIPATGFYLLERTSDDSLPGIPAEQIYTGALGNEGENLSLTDSAGNIVDQVNAIPWFFGDNTTEQTMQRKDALVSGSDSANWQNSNLPGGTPKL